MNTKSTKWGRQYVGITGVTSSQQVIQLQRTWESYSPKSEVLVGPGVMTRFKTFKRLPSKWTESDPQPKDFAGILSNGRTFNILHYADYSGDEDFLKTFQGLVGAGGKSMDALQLDMVWPDANMLANAIHHARVGGQFEIILQVGSDALNAAHNSVREVAHRIDDYVRDECVHRVLFDCSMGEGKLMDPSVLLPYARAIRARHPEMRFVFAGGLSGETLDVIDAILVEFPDASFDAEGKMRVSGNAIDPIDMDCCARYLQAAGGKFGNLC